MENGSGGFMSDLRFSGGRYGMWVGNQQVGIEFITMSPDFSGAFNIFV